MKDPNINKSIEWLISIQNKDGGWGMYDYDPSRVVTTAEAVTALAITNSHNDSLQKGVEYLIRGANDPNWCQYHRHHAWTVYALTRAGFGDNIPSRCLQTLQKSHLKGSWGHASGEIPTIYPTFLGLMALNNYGKSRKVLKQTCEWIVSQFNNNS